MTFNPESNSIIIIRSKFQKMFELSRSHRHMYELQFASVLKASAAAAITHRYLNNVARTNIQTNVNVIKIK